MTKEKIHKLSRVKPADADSLLRARERHTSERGRALDVLMQAQRCWDNMADFRAERERNKRYCYGHQWDDTITVDGVRMTEAQYIKKQGSVPLKNNLIRRLVRNVIGVYRSQSKEPTCSARDRDEQQLGEVMSTTLQYNMQLNEMGEVYSRTMEEFLISGVAVHRKWFGWRDDKLDCWTDYVQPNNFFIDSNMRDFRGMDVSLLGEVHDIDYGTLISVFAQSPEDYKRLDDIYRAARDQHSIREYYDQFGYSHRKDYDFLFADDGRCRVIEVWRKEQKARYRCRDYNSGEIFKIEIEDYDELVGKVNAGRLAQGRAAGIPDDEIPLIETEWFIDSYWYFYYLTPFGDILKEGETPYEHKTHPYVFKVYPFIDGEVHSFVADVIDQQRYTNRLITMYDWIMRASAKGVLLVPEDCLGDVSIQDVADTWSSFNGVLALKMKPGAPIPQQISANATNIGIAELLNVQLKFFEDISGVNGALQGKPGYSGTSGSLYAQQTQNATTSLLDILETFSNFVKRAAYKDVKNMQQFYDDKRFTAIAGTIAEGLRIDSNSIRNTEWDISIEESTSTPAYRQIANDLLLQIWQSGQITLRQLLEVGEFPFADQLLQSISSQQEQMAQGQPVEGIDPELMNQVQEGADMKAVARAYNMLKE